MKKIKISSVGIFVLLLAFFISCKKETANEPAPTPASSNTTSKTAAQSDQQGSSEADGAVNDVNDYINNNIGRGSSHKMEAYNLPCGVIYLDSSSTNGGGHKIYKMNYGYQSPCGYKKKSGVVSFELLNSIAFNNAGSMYKLTFKNYVVQSLADGDTVKINGYLTVKNVTGGYIWEAITLGSSISYQIRGTYSVTFANKEVRDKKYFQLRTYNSPTKTWAGLNFTIAGDTTINNKIIYETGKTYDGNYDYQIESINSFVWSNCGATYAGPYLLKSAHVKMNVIVPSISPTYIDIEGGYFWKYSDPLSQPVLINDCSSNAYKITTVLGTNTTVKYQLY
jgi:hypothetical protein